MSRACGWCFPWKDDVFFQRRGPNGVKGRNSLQVMLAGVINKIVKVKEAGGCIELEDVVPSRGKIITVGERSHG